MFPFFDLATRPFQTAGVTCYAYAMAIKPFLVPLDLNFLLDPDSEFHSVLSYLARFWSQQSTQPSFEWQEPSYPDPFEPYEQYSGPVIYAVLGLLSLLACYMLSKDSASKKVLQPFLSETTKPYKDEGVQVVLSSWQEDTITLLQQENERLNEDNRRNSAHTKHDQGTQVLLLDREKDDAIDRLQRESGRCDAEKRAKDAIIEQKQQHVEGLIQALLQKGATLDSIQQELELKSGSICQLEADIEKANSTIVQQNDDLRAKTDTERQLRQKIDQIENLQSPQKQQIGTLKAQLQATHDAKVKAEERQQRTEKSALQIKRDAEKREADHLKLLEENQVILDQQEKILMGFDVDLFRQLEQESQKAKQEKRSSADKIVALERDVINIQREKAVSKEQDRRETEELKSKLSTAASAQRKAEEERNGLRANVASVEERLRAKESSMSALNQELSAAKTSLDLSERQKTTSQRREAALAKKLEDATAKERKLKGLESSVGNLERKNGVLERSNAELNKQLDDAGSREKRLQSLERSTGLLEQEKFEWQRREAALLEQLRDAQAAITARPTEDVSVSQVSTQVPFPSFPQTPDIQSTEDASAASTLQQAQHVLPAEQHPPYNSTSPFGEVPSFSEQFPWDQDFGLENVAATEPVFDHGQIGTQTTEPVSDQEQMDTQPTDSVSDQEQMDTEMISADEVQATSSVNTGLKLDAEDEEDVKAFNDSFKDSDGPLTQLQPDSDSTPFDFNNPGGNVFDELLPDASVDPSTGQHLAASTQISTEPRESPYFLPSATTVFDEAPISQEHPAVSSQAQAQVPEGVTDDELLGLMDPKLLAFNANRPLEYWQGSGFLSDEPHVQTATEPPQMSAEQRMLADLTDFENASNREDFQVPPLDKRKERDEDEVEAADQAAYGYGDPSTTFPLESTQDQPEEPPADGLFGTFTTSFNSSTIGQRQTTANAGMTQTGSGSRNRHVLQHMTARRLHQPVLASDPVSDRAQPASTPLFTTRPSAPQVDQPIASVFHGRPMRQAVPARFRQKPKPVDPPTSSEQQTQEKVETPSEDQPAEPPSTSIARPIWNEEPRFPELPPDYPITRVKRFDRATGYIESSSESDDDAEGEEEEEEEEKEGGEVSDDGMRDAEGETDPDAEGEPDPETKDEFKSYAKGQSKPLVERYDADRVSRQIKEDIEKAKQQVLEHYRANPGSESGSEESEAE